MTWVGLQAIKLGPDKKTVLLRSFPFWALSFEHARADLLEMKKQHDMPFTHIVQFVEIRETSGKLAKAQTYTRKMNIQLGVFE